MNRMPQEKTWNLDGQVRAMRRRLHRERLARLDAEEIAETTIRILYDKQRELRLFEAIIAVSNESSTVEQMLKGAVKAVCTHTKWPVGHAFVRDPVLGYLVPTGIWHVSPPGAYEEFRRATEAATFDEGEGLPGLVLETGEARWIADTDPVAVRRGMGLRSAFAFPIPVEGRVEGVVEVFSPATNTWSRASSMPAGRYGHAAVTLPDGKIVVIGGQRAVNPPSVPNDSTQSPIVDVLTP